jgi:hypothetical protein
MVCDGEILQRIKQTSRYLSPEISLARSTMLRRSLASLSAMNALTSAFRSHKAGKKAPRKQLMVATNRNLSVAKLFALPGDNSAESRRSLLRVWPTLRKGG